MPADRELTFDEAESLGYDGTLRDDGLICPWTGGEPVRLSDLTPEQRQALDEA